MATDTTPVDVGFRSERGPILVSLMLTTSLVALDATIISTAVFTIVGDLGGFSQFPWLFSIYLLTQPCRCRSTASWPTSSAGGR